MTTHTEIRCLDEEQMAQLRANIEHVVRREIRDRIIEYCELEGLPPVAYGAADIAMGQTKRLEHLRAIKADQERLERLRR